MRARAGEFLLPFLGILLLGLLLSGAAPRLEAVPSEDFLETAEEILAEVSRIRGLETLREIRKGVKSRDEIRAFLVKRIERDHPREDVEADQKMLRMLGVIPDDLDLYSFLIDLLTEQVAGVYDPDSETFYIADWIPARQQAPVMAHELVHALQDQHFDLSRFLKPIPGNDDATLARSALIEGEAVGVMFEYLLHPMGLTLGDLPDLAEINRSQVQLLESQYPLFAEAPNYIREVLLFPYLHGANFIRSFLSRYSWEEIGRLYDDLPVSTEQILHPEKYLEKREDPRALPEPERAARLGGGWDRIHQNVLGQFGLFLVLSEFLEAEEADRASRGWGADRVTLLRQEDGRLALLIETLWDTPQDAVDFFEGYSALIERKHPKAVPVDSGEGEGQSADPFEDTRQWRSEKAQVQLNRRGSSVDALELWRVETTTPPHRSSEDSGERRREAETVRE